MRVLFLWWVCLFACASSQQAAIKEPQSAPAPPASQPLKAPLRQIAITLDDLPWVGGLAPGDSRAAATERLLDTLADYQVPAFGFVTCRNIKDGEEALLMRWRSFGFSLGNHTTSHRALDTMPLQDWLADVQSCGERLQKLTGEPVVWFRYPQLRMGRDKALRDKARKAVEEMGYQIGHVSVDTSEWLLTRAYQEALSNKDAAKATEVVAAYQKHILDAVYHYEAVSQRKLGRNIPHILLLHANALAADHLGDVLSLLQKDGFVFISLEQALKDPAYQLPDAYAGEWGVSWLNRIEPLDLPDVAAWDKEEMKKISAQFGLTP